jgi:hypothetical protein
LRALLSASGLPKADEPADETRRAISITTSRARLTRSLEEALRLGRDAGGDNLVSWDESARKFVCKPRGEGTLEGLGQKGLALLVEEILNSAETEEARRKRLNRLVERVLESEGARGELTTRRQMRQVVESGLKQISAPEGNGHGPAEFSEG